MIFSFDNSAGEWIQKKEETRNKRQVQERFDCAKCTRGIYKEMLEFLRLRLANDEGRISIRVFFVS